MSDVARSEPDWLVWAREIQGIAQSGLTFTKDNYDRERYEQLRALAAHIMAAHSSTDAARIEALFAQQQGYATPKVEVRGAAFRDGRILMVREVSDGDRWTLPGGWADVNLSAAENVAKEMVEETGFIVRVTKLAAALDHSKQGPHPTECILRPEAFLPLRDHRRRGANQFRDQRNWFFRRERDST